MGRAYDGHTSGNASSYRDDQRREVEKVLLAGV